MIIAGGPLYTVWAHKHDSLIYGVVYILRVHIRCRILQKEPAKLLPRHRSVRVKYYEVPPGVKVLDMSLTFGSVQMKYLRNAL
jgi:hypothetical protein